MFDQSYFTRTLGVICQNIYPFLLVFEVKIVYLINPKLTREPFPRLNKRERNTTNSTKHRMTSIQSGCTFLQTICENKSPRN